MTAMMIVAMVVWMMMIVRAGGDRPILVFRGGQMNMFACAGLL